MFSFDPEKNITNQMLKDIEQSVIKHPDKWHVYDTNYDSYIWFENKITNNIISITQFHNKSKIGLKIKLYNPNPNPSQYSSDYGVSKLPLTKKTRNKLFSISKKLIIAMVIWNLSTSYTNLLTFSSYQENATKLKQIEETSSE